MLTQCSSLTFTVVQSHVVAVMQIVGVLAAYVVRSGVRP
jgi:hypothetical protein